MFRVTAESAASATIPVWGARQYLSDKMITVHEYVSRTVQYKQWIPNLDDRRSNNSVKAVNHLPKRRTTSARSTRWEHSRSGFRVAIHTERSCGIPAQFISLWTTTTDVAKTELR
jgi:hypothetical protein